MTLASQEIYLSITSGQKPAEMLQPQLTSNILAYKRRKAHRQQESKYINKMLAIILYFLHYKGLLQCNVNSEQCIL